MQASLHLPVRLARACREELRGIGCQGRVDPVLPEAGGLVGSQLALRTFREREVFAGGRFLSSKGG